MNFLTNNLFTRAAQNQNLTPLERAVLRFVIGFAVTVWAIAGDPIKTAFATFQTTGVFTLDWHKQDLLLLNAVQIAFWLAVAHWFSARGSSRQAVGDTAGAAQDQQFAQAAQTVESAVATGAGIPQSVQPPADITFPSQGYAPTTNPTTYSASMTSATALPGVPSITSYGSASGQVTFSAEAMPLNATINPES